MFVLHFFPSNSPTLQSDIIVDTYYVDANRFGATRLDSVRLAQTRRHDIPPSCAPEFDTRSTQSRDPSRG
ncbi:hypothetical protein Hanom_Chr17g01570561 [Helianthus anomalus]